MVKTTLSEPTSTERVLEIEVPRANLEKIFEEKVKKYSKEIRINGFRPGNVPKQVVAARFKDPISAESLEALVEESVREACKEHNIEPVGPGKIDKLENQPDKPIVIKAILEVDPVIEIKDYRLNIPLNPPEVGEEAIEAQLKAFQKRKAEEKRVERPAQEGDVVVAEYLSIVLDGEVQALPKYREFRIELGAGNLPELDKALLGCVEKEERDIHFTFPEDYNQANLAGKTSEYRLLIQEVKELIPPALDDAFAQEFGFESLDAMRAKIKADMEKNALAQVKDEAYEEAMRRLMESNPFDVPHARIANYVKYKLEQAGHTHAPGEEHGHDHSDVEREAEFNIKRFRILDEVSKKEKIKAGPEEVDERIRELAMQYGTDFDTLKATLRKNGKIIDIREEIKSEKTLDFIIGANRPEGE